MTSIIEYSPTWLLRHDPSQLKQFQIDWLLATHDLVQGRGDDVVAA